MYLFVNSLSKNKKIIALIQKGKIFKKITILTKDNHSENILKDINKLFKKSKKKLENIRGIIVVNGPGSFVGIRIVLSIVNALAWFLKIPVCGVSLNDGNSNQELIEAGLKHLIEQKVNRLSKPFYGKELNITKPKL